MKKQDSAFVYAILESHEGIASFTTLDSPPGCMYRDVELNVPNCFINEVDFVLSKLKDVACEIV